MITCVHLLTIIGGGGQTPSTVRYSELMLPIVVVTAAIFHLVEVVAEAPAQDD